MEVTAPVVHRDPWNKGKIVGQKAPFKPEGIWALRVRLQMESRARELALLNFGIDSKVRGCDLVSLRVRDVCYGDQVASRAVVMQHKTQRPVQFEITATTRDTLQKWIKAAGLKADNFLFPCRLHSSPHLGTSQCARILEHWVENWAWIRRTTALIQCAAQRRRSYIAGPTIFALFSCHLTTPSSSRPSAILASRSTMLLRFLNRRKSDSLVQQLFHVRRPGCAHSCL